MQRYLSADGDVTVDDDDVTVDDDEVTVVYKTRAPGHHVHNLANYSCTWPRANVCN